MVDDLGVKGQVSIHLNIAYHAAAPANLIYYLSEATTPELRQGTLYLAEFWKGHPRHSYNI